MNCFLLDKIDAVENGILATILSTEGHTYKKRGSKALYAAGNPHAFHGNLGSLCVDQDITRAGEEAAREGTPRVITVDTSSEEDAELGYGTYCGGKMELLLEPIGDAQREIYRQLRPRLSGSEATWLVHNLTSGALTLETTSPKAKDGALVEKIQPLRRLFLFGATPLATSIIRVLNDSSFDVHVVDWRTDLLERCRNTEGVTAHEDDVPFEEGSAVLLLSHSFHRDKAALRNAIEAGASWIGMLSSRKRRDRMFEELVSEGVNKNALERVSSPAGIDIGAVSDAEIAVSIVAELIRSVH